MGLDDQRMKIFTVHSFFSVHHFVPFALSLFFNILILGLNEYTGKTFIVFTISESDVYEKCNSETNK